MSTTEYNATRNLSKEGLTQLSLKYGQKLQQGIKADEMLDDLFIYTAGLRIIRTFDSTGLDLAVDTKNLITSKEIRWVLDAMKCIRIKYNVVLDYDYYLNLELGGIDPTALFTESGLPLWTEASEYILTE